MKLTKKQFKYLSIAGFVGVDNYASVTGKDEITLGNGDEKKLAKILEDSPKWEADLDDMLANPPGRKDPAQTAFARLISDYKVRNGYDEKLKAITKASEDVKPDAQSDDIYAAALELLK